MAATFKAQAGALTQERDFIIDRVPEPTARQRDFDRAQRDPAYRQFLVDMAEAEAQNINMPTDESRFARTVGEGIGTRFLTALDNADVQRQRLAQYERLGNLLLDDDVFTGTGGQAIQSLKRLAGTFLGIEGIEGMENVEAAERIRAEMFAGFRQDMLSGPTSNADRQFILNIPPNVTDSKRGIALVIELQRKAAEAADRRAAILENMIAESETGTLNAQDWVDYQRRAAEITAFSPEDMEQARLASIDAAKQNGPLAGLPLERLPEDIFNDAIQGLLEREEVEAYLRSQGSAP